MQRMKWKKNLLGYLLWICFCITVCTALVTAGVQILDRVGITAPWTVAVMAVLFAAEAGLFFWLYPDKRKRQEEKEKKHGWTKYLPEFVAGVLLIALRFAAAMAYGMSPVGDTTLYEMAEIAGMESVPLLPHNASYVYACLLSVLLRFLGNKWTAVAVMQILLQLVASFLFFAVVRKLYGRCASVAFLLLASVMPDFLFRYNRITPDLLLGVLAGMILWTAAEIWNGIGEGKGWKCGFFSILTGLLLGIFVWLDLSGLLLGLAVLLGITQLQNTCGVRRKGIFAGCVTVGLFGALSGAFLVESQMTGIRFFDVLFYYIRPYIADLRLVVPQTEELFSLIATVMLCLLAGMAVVGFLKQDYEKTLIAAVMLSGITVLRYFNMTQVSYMNLENLFWMLAVCAGISCLADAYAENPGVETALSENLDAETAHTENTGEMKKEKETTEVTEQKQASEGNYIPNPLPLPKKHVKREIRFDYEPLPEQMDFDYELKKGEEDFDIL